MSKGQFILFNSEAGNANSLINWLSAKLIAGKNTSALRVVPFHIGRGRHKVTAISYMHRSDVGFNPDIISALPKDLPFTVMSCVDKNNGMPSLEILKKQAASFFQFEMQSLQHTHPSRV